MWGGTGSSYGRSGRGRGGTSKRESDGRSKMRKEKKGVRGKEGSDRGE